MEATVQEKNELLSRHLNVGNYLNWFRFKDCMEDIYVDKPCLFEIETVHSISNIADATEKFEGIPLTEEWLLKFGFIHDGSGFYSHPTENFKLYHNTVGQYFESYKDVPANDETGHFKILYFVHKLQNLFFELHEEELTIKEPVL